MNDPSPAEVIFFAALEKATPAERAAYLDEACAGKDALRRRVEALLAAQGQVDQFLERPVVEAEGVAALGGAVDAAADLSFLAPPTGPGSLGRLGHYEVLEVVGKGGTGVVLRARDTKLLRVVALKVLAAPLAASGTPRQRFTREARATAAVRDEHVIGIYAVEDHGPLPYLVMEFIEGCNLEALLRRSGPLEIKEVLRIGIQVANGLAAAHKQGLIHRDIKPANILLENGVQRVKLTDFGLARAADDASLTQSGYIAGTPLYMAPEQATGEPIGPRADLFSLGSVLYEMCTGRPAFRAATTLAVLKRVCEDTPRPIREVNPDVPDSVCALIGRLLAKKPADRPASAKEVANLLAEVLADLQGPATATLPAAAPAPVAPRRAGPTRLWLCAAAALALLAGLGLGESAGVTNLGGTALRLFFPDGTLVVEVDDPAVSVAIDGEELIITGAGAREIRLKPGQYRVQASKGGKVLQQELVTVTRDGRQLVRISKEAAPQAGAERWERSVAGLSAEGQVEAVAWRLRELNPGFDGKVIPTVENGAVRGLEFSTANVSDISPLRALRRLESLDASGRWPKEGKLSDLAPLRDLPLKRLLCGANPIADLSPLGGAPLKHLGCGATRVSDLTPLKGMALESLELTSTPTADLTPLAQSKSLRALLLDGTPVSDLSPLRGLPLSKLAFRDTRVADPAPIKAMPLAWLGIDYQADREGLLRSLTGLKVINDKPAAEFWKTVAAK